MPSSNQLVSESASNPLSVLIVDDDVQVAAFYKALLTKHGFVSDISSTLSELSTRLLTTNYDSILLDLELGREDGLQGLSIVLKESPKTRVFILTGHGSVDRAVEAMRKGASGFFEKGGRTDVLIHELHSRPHEQTQGAVRVERAGLIGQSPALELVLQKIERLRDVDSSILLLGESGTGKEVIARTIHRSSKRAGHRFSAINCGAIPENLLESELFGHKRGAFTDAKTDRKGIFELASSGTLLLDEIGDMPLSLQMKLLRVLQEKEITPVGSSETIKIDTRIIAATHQDIGAQANSKMFREDLYYRLSIVVLRVPPLRERIEDIPLLVQHFIGVFNERFDRAVAMPTPCEMSRLMAYRWPGNIRELQNAMERAVVLSIDNRIDFDDVFAGRSFSSEIENRSTLANRNDSLVVDTNLNVHDPRFELPLTDAKQAFEKAYLEHAVQACRGNVNSLAEKSGRYRADVYRLLRRYGIEHHEYRQ
jgi:two-component system response regulator GlrR